MPTAPDVLLWDPATLAARLHEDGVVVLDVRRGESYANGHVPGARHFQRLRDQHLRQRSCPARLVHPDVGPSRSRAPASGARTWWWSCSETTDESAARAFWFLEYLGHERVAVLDGGVRAWEAAGQPLTHEAAPPKASAYRYEAVASVCASWSDVAAAIDDPATVILDTRSDGEWYGEDPRDAARGGAVPGAVHLEWLHNVDDQGRMLDAETLRERYAGVGIAPETPVIAYCNTGYRSAHA